MKNEERKLSWLDCKNKNCLFFWSLGTFIKIVKQTDFILGKESD